MYSQSPTTFSAIIDTGFNGYLQLPFADALPLGLVLTSVEPTTLANGSTINNLLFLGNVTLQGKSSNILITVLDQCPILLGTALLKAASKDLTIDFTNSTFDLIDHT